MRFIHLLFVTALLALGLPAAAQRITDSGHRTAGHIKSDGTIQDASYRTVGHIKSDGTVQDASYRTIGHAQGIPRNWTAFYFFFCK